MRTPEEIRPALEAAFASGKPAVIDVYVAPEAVPPMPGFWELPTPEYLARELKGRA